jgi:hypothetical protein
MDLAKLEFHTICLLLDAGNMTQDQQNNTFFTLLSVSQAHLVYQSVENDLFPRTSFTIAVKTGVGRPTVFIRTRSMKSRLASGKSNSISIHHVHI